MDYAYRRRKLWSVVASRHNVRVIDRLTTRQLNRATVARQLLLERADYSAERVLQHLVGMQSQAPLAPYIGLWTRVVDFRADELSALMIERRVVRASLMRATIHLVTAADFLQLWPVLEPVSERGLWTGSPFGRRVPRAMVNDLLAFVRHLLREAPRTRAELRRLIGQRWPNLDADAMAYAAQYLLPIVQVTPRGVWGQSKAPTWADAEIWIGDRMSTGAAVDDLVLRYLGAFGPASVQDVQVWSGLTRLGEVADGLGPRVRRFRSEDGRVLLDGPDAPRPPADTPAPIRFLPEYDNLLLSHADRSRGCPSSALCRYGQALVGTVARCWSTVSGAPTGESCPTVVKPISISKPFSRCLDVRRLLWPPRDIVCSPLPRRPLPVTSGFQSPEAPPWSQPACSREHHHVVRPPTVPRAIGAPSRGHSASILRAGRSERVWTPPCRSAESTVRRSARNSRSTSARESSPTGRAGLIFAVHSI